LFKVVYKVNNFYVELLLGDEIIFRVQKGEGCKVYKVYKVRKVYKGCKVYKVFKVCKVFKVYKVYKAERSEVPSEAIRDF